MLRQIITFAPSALLLLAAQTVFATPVTQPASLPRAGSQPARKPPRVPRAQGEQRLHVLFTSDIYGRYAWPGCHRRNPTRASLAHLIGAVAAERSAIQRAEGVAPVVVAAGSTVRPDVLGNFVFRDAPKLAPKAAALLGRVGFDGLAVGLYDFGVEPHALERYLRLMRARRVPMLAGNVSCKSAADFRCKHLAGQYRVVQRGSLRVGIFAVVRDDLTSQILSRSSGSLLVKGAVDWARTVIRDLRRKQRVDVVVALANLNAENDAPLPVLQWVRHLGKDAPELVVANGMFEPGSKDHLRQIKRGKTTIVGTGRFAQQLGHAVIRLRRRGRRRELVRIDVRRSPTVGYRADGRAVPVVREMMRAMCRHLDRPLGRASFKRKMTHQQFIGYLMEIMRKRTRAELAVLNHSCTADTSFPMKGTLTWEKLLRAIRTETALGTVKLLGTRLKKLLARHLPGDSGLQVVGLTKKGLRWYVNGRPLVDGHSYRVAITKFVADGGEQLVKLFGLERFASSGVSLRDVVTDFFGSDGQAEHDRRADVDLAADFPDLKSKWLLYLDIDVGFNFANTWVNNLEAAEGGGLRNRYSLPLLKRDNITSLAANLHVGFGASTRNHALEGDLQLQYGHTWTKLNDGTDEAASAEVVDRIVGSVIYKLRRLRNAFGSHWYIPEPYAEARVISELTASGECADCTDPGDQEYHYLELGGTVGVGLTLHPLFFVKLGAVVRGELLTPEAANADITARPGLYLGYLLRKWKIIASREHPLRLESRLDFYFTDLGDELRRELTLQSKLYFALWRMINLTVTHNFYVFDKRSADASVANDVSVGLAFLFDYRRQTF